MSPIDPKMIDVEAVSERIYVAAMEGSFYEWLQSAAPDLAGITTHKQIREKVDNHAYAGASQVCELCWVNIFVYLAY